MFKYVIGEFFIIKFLELVFCFPLIKPDSKTLNFLEEYL